MNRTHWFWIWMCCALPLLAGCVPAAWEAWGPNWALSAIHVPPGGAPTAVTVVDGPLDGPLPPWLHRGPDFTSGRSQGRATHAWRVASLIHAVNPDAQVTVVTVLDGQGRGRRADILRGLAWAAGQPVPGAPVNRHPARVINASLVLAAPDSQCAPDLQRVVAAAAARGTVLVAAAGNDGGRAATRSPANCAGVVAVTALTVQLQVASYANTGASVAVAAPGGDARDGIDLGFGTSASGTSYAAPLVAGAVSRALALHPGWSSEALRDQVRRSARPLAQAACPGGGCGAGLLQVDRLLWPNL
ncbi:S8 family serine peptidase [Deinococcus kurensis]|uniref:S8 family serine peptidase n=1 Tax=Deinococcus kurensis TaxID=2662757 RepID=UPI0012D2EFD7|nr:S8 family serine peptidase [Deinococcus kurensis]